MNTDKIIADAIAPIQNLEAHPCRDLSKIKNDISTSIAAFIGALDASDEHHEWRGVLIDDMDWSKDQKECAAARSSLETVLYSLTDNQKSALMAALLSSVQVENHPILSALQDMCFAIQKAAAPWAEYGHNLSVYLA